MGQICFKDEDETQNRHVYKEVNPDTPSSGQGIDLEYETLTDPDYLNSSTDNYYQSLNAPIATETQQNAKEDVQLPDEDETQNRHVYNEVNPDTPSSGQGLDLEYEALADPDYVNSSTDNYYQSLNAPIATETQQNAKEDVQLPVKDNFRPVVAAIDFGTTYSGWSYALRDDFLTDPTKVTIKNWSSGNLTSCKTPTCILISPDGVSVEAFGYDAETKYAELVRAGRHKDYYFFSRFKMELHKSIQQGVKRNFELASATGKCLKANDVFALSIKWLKEDLLSEWASRLPGAINEADVHWMLTVPAIWSDAAKQFMHEAAMKAGINAKRLSIALEPEVASVVCRYTTLQEASDVHFKDGLKYLILDAGGGTIDVTVHEIVGKNILKKLRWPAVEDGAVSR